MHPRTSKRGVIKKSIALVLFEVRLIIAGKTPDTSRASPTKREEKESPEKIQGQPGEQQVNASDIASVCAARARFEDLLVRIEETVKKNLRSRK